MPPESTHATSHGPPESSSMEGGAGGVEDVVVSPQPIQVVRAKKKVRFIKVIFPGARC